MKYYDIAAYIGGEKWAKKRLKKMRETNDRVEQLIKSHDLADEDCIKAAEALRSEAEYSVHTINSIGALGISCLSFIASIVTFIISTFFNGEKPLVVSIILIVLLSISTFFVVYTWGMAYKNNQEYIKARILEDSLRLLKKDGLFRKDGQKEENELTKRSETL